MIAPGRIETTLMYGVSDEVNRELVKSVPLGRHGIPRDVANAVLFLASDLSAYITGATIDVNGGRLMI